MVSKAMMRAQKKYRKTERCKQTQRRYKQSKKGQETTRKYNLRVNYNITIQDVEQMKLHQNNCCAICNREMTLFVDHNHKTGKVRALLCRYCNMGLGCIERDPTLMPKMLEYLEKYNKGD